MSPFLNLLLAAGGTRTLFAQSAVQAGTTPAKDQFFTGTVMAIDDTSLTVSRGGSAKNAATKMFIVAADTKFEGGKPQVRAQVTVRYITTEDGDRAVHVILRRSPR